MYLSNLVNLAVELAAIAHREQMRKSPEARIPYIHHLSSLDIWDPAGPDHCIVDEEL